MTLTRAALDNPVAALVGVLLLFLFGVIALFRLPIQLTPEVEAPEITITTSWRAAAPEEVEAEIIEPQEEVLRGLPGLTEMLAKAQRGSGEISLTFAIGTNLDRALLEVLNRLNRVARYPDDADEPVLSAIGGEARAIAWFIITPQPGNERDIQSYQEYVEEVVQTRFERVPGVARSEVYGGRDQELRITIDPYKAAHLGVELPLVAQLAGGNEDVSGGVAHVGKRRYTIRFTGAYQVEDFTSMILDWRDRRPVTLGDIAEVELRMVDPQSFVITADGKSLAVNAQRETGVNVLEVMKGLHAAEAELREGPLARAQLKIEQVYDETTYIYRAIEMLTSNLGLGILLAVGVLWWFLRKLRATLVVALAIPLSLFGAFLLMNAAGRTLNVISLAGLAFAVGMVLDAAIVVLENIVRLRERGDPEAALRGAMQVWGALLASTATTVAIFLPVLFLEDEAGQLFADLALAITVAVITSLLVALIVVPTAAQSWLRRMELHDAHANWWQAGTRGIMTLTGGPLRRGFWIALLISLASGLTYWLAPKADYLPEGNRNLVFAFILPPPGVNIDHLEHEMGQVVAERIGPYLTGEQQPQVKHYFFVAFSQGVFMGAMAEDESRVDELLPVINQAIGGFPDTIAFALRASLFGDFGAGRTIDINLQGRDIERLMEVGGAGFGMISELIPGAETRPFPGLELADPELRLIPDERRIREAGWDRATLAQITRALGQGLYVGDYFDGEKQRDIIARIQPWETPEQLAAIPLQTPQAGILPVRELVELLRTAGPEEIRRLDRRRTVTLQVTPPADMSLEEALTLLQRDLNPQLEAMLPEDAAIRYSGTADKLEVALTNMGGSFLLAIAILFLLMAALFRSFRDSLLVILALPLATVGGVAALKIANIYIFQPMDLLTMIGFIILLGLVVNNAILLVHQTRAAEREGLSRRDAVEQAVHLRLRPILMSTLTSIFGMLPLLLIPGAGSELYRGLAAVIVGGMTVSTLFTLILLPSLLRLGERKVLGSGSADAS